MRTWWILLLFLFCAGGSVRAQYVVASGDTLSGIAKRTLGDGNRWREIADLNGLAAPYRLRVGQRLQMPRATTEAPSPAVVPKPPAAPVAPVVPVAAETQPLAMNGGLSDDQEAEMVSQFLSGMIGRDIVLPNWLVSIRAVFFLFAAIVLLIYVPFWATGVMFAMFLFRMELIRWDAIKTAMSWAAILLGTLLPISFMGWEPEAFAKYLPWMIGLGLLAFLLSVRAAKKHTGCSTLQSPFVCLLGFVFGCAAFETLIYVVVIAVGIIAGIVFSIF